MKENGLLRIHVTGETNSYVENQGMCYAYVHITFIRVNITHFFVFLILLRFHDISFIYILMVFDVQRDTYTWDVEVVYNNVVVQFFHILAKTLQICFKCSTLSTL